MPRDTASGRARTVSRVHPAIVPIERAENGKPDTRIRRNSLRVRLRRMVGRGDGGDGDVGGSAYTGVPEVWRNGHTDNTGCRMTHFQPGPSPCRRGPGP